jgi:hypothetical protein
VTDDTAAITAAIGACPPGGTVYFPVGTYATSAPITVPPYVGLLGTPATVLVASWDGHGAVIKPSASWAQGSAVLPAVLLMVDQATGGYPTASQEQKISHLMIDGSALPPATTCHGIASFNAVNRVQLREVHVARMTGSGIYQYHPSAQPGGWTAQHVWSRYNGGYGYFLRSADSNWTKCLATNSGLDGWNIDTTANTIYLGCRSEWSGRNGYSYACNNAGNAAGGVNFVGCTTDRSTQHGFTAAGPAGIPVNLAGCYLRRDGANNGQGGGGYAGLHLSGYPGVANVSGTVIYPGVNDDGTGTTSPQYAVYLAGGNTLVEFSGCFLQGANTAVFDDGTSTVHWDDATSFATGPTSSPTYLAAAATGGTATFTGDGRTTAFTISHRLYKAPSRFSVTPASRGAAAPFYAAASATALTVTFTTAPARGTGLALAWTAHA